MARRQVLTGQGSAHSQIFIDEGGGGSAFTGLPILNTGVLVGSAQKLNFIGASSVVIDGGDPTQINVTITPDTIGTLATVYAAGANNADSTLTLDGTRGALTLTYNALGTAQTVGLLINDATTAGVGTPQYSPVVSILGTVHNGAASQVGGWAIQAQGVDTTINTDLTWYHNIGGALTERLNFHIRNANTIQIQDARGAFVELDGPDGSCRLGGSTGNFLGLLFNQPGWEFNIGGTTYVMSAANIYADNNAAAVLGIAAHPWSSVEATAYHVYSGANVVTASIAFDATGMVLSNASTGAVVTLDDSVGVYLQYTVSSFIQIASTGVNLTSSNLNFNNNRVDAPTAVATEISTVQQFSSAGASLIKAYSGTGNELFYGVHSGIAHTMAIAAENFTCSGTVAAGDVVVWTGTNTVATAGASANLTTIAGVAITGGTNAVIMVCRRGRCVTNCENGVTVGQLVGTSGGTAGRADATTPGAGAIVGRATDAVNGNGEGANKITIDVILG